MTGKKRSATRLKDPIQEGIALLMALIALLILSVIALYLAMVATAEVRISDNFESHYRAHSAALAGLSHARALLPGLRFDDLLPGPDGTYDTSPAYLAAATAYSYRMPISWAVARMLDILNPAGDLSGNADDGIISTGHHPGGNGQVLIPLTGIAHSVANPNGPGVLYTSRYFVRASDNNGEGSELAADPANNPFIDGDGQIILRSTGIARTLGEGTPTRIRNNSAVVFEARYKRFSTYDLDAPLVVQSSAVASASGSMFYGNTFLIQGGPSTSGIATIDTSSADGTAPAQQILSRLAPIQTRCLQGAGLEPSIRDITSFIAAHPDKQLLLDKAASWRFIRQSLPQFADNVFSGAQNWIGAAPLPLGSYDPTLPVTVPGQDPRVTFVDGDLTIDGNLVGGGLLVVTGRVTILGHFVFSGIILVLGSGELDIGGRSSISGGVFLACLTSANGDLSWGTAKLSVRDTCQIVFNRDVIRMAVSLIPPVQLGIREITPVIDP
jgi:hypothetical protein